MFNGLQRMVSRSLLESLTTIQGSQQALPRILSYNGGHFFFLSSFLFSELLYDVEAWLRNRWIAEDIRTGKYRPICQTYPSLPPMRSKQKY